MDLFSGKIVFLILSTILVYKFAPQKSRWPVLLLASYGFYALWNWQYVGIIVLVTAGSYWVGRRIPAASQPTTRRAWLVFGLVIVLGNLFIFKYFYYVLGIIRKFAESGLETRIPSFDLAAPLGISFFSLQVVSYLVDVYRGKQAPEAHLGRYALFVVFFGQVVAGPISRARNLLPQFKNLPPLVTEDLYTGLFRILVGAAQKYVIADRLAILINPIFDNLQDYSSLSLVIGAYLFAVQIYMDFAGYTNIALGIARLFSINLPENFKQPYLARDFSEFWNRWHISLSHWLRDYIFYPTLRYLRGLKRYQNPILIILIPPLVTMLVSGIWHGSGVHFLFWGLLHGVLIAISAATLRWRKNLSLKYGPRWTKIFNTVQTLTTFHLLVVSWLFFRLPKIGLSFAYLEQIFSGAKGVSVLDPVNSSMIFVLVAGFLILEVLFYKKPDFSIINERPFFTRWAVIYFLIFLVLWMGNFESIQPFIYEQF